FRLVRSAGIPGCPLLPQTCPPLRGRTDRHVCPYRAKPAAQAPLPRALWQASLPGSRRYRCDLRTGKRRASRGWYLFGEDHPSQKWRTRARASAGAWRLSGGARNFSVGASYPFSRPSLFKKESRLLLESFAALPPQSGSSEMLLVFAGPDEGGMAGRLAQMTAKLGVASRVRFTGPVFGEEKWAAYRDADIFVLPSQNENFGNTAAEAAAAGTPVIVTEHCAIAKILPQNAAVVVPHDAAALRDALRNLLTDAATRSRLSSAGAAAASKLGWQQPVLDMQSLYTKVATSMPRGGKSKPTE